MANPEHLAILKQGVEAWNRWREKYGYIRPQLSRAQFSGRRLRGAQLRSVDLSWADLNRADLIKADLTGANLEGADLSWANLSEATLSEADLSYADLQRANLSRGVLGRTRLRNVQLRLAELSGAQLWGADLIGADLSGANLSGARLEQAYLKGANLSGANLTAANVRRTFFHETVFGDTLLKNVDTLDKCECHGPCTIDNRTLAKSWPLPLKFLRGCGLTDDFIEYIPSLLARPFEFYSCFISYSSTNQGFAERLHADLQDKGVRCWFAPEDLKIGDRIRPRLDESIRLYDKLLLILSETSLASQWIEQEVESALEKERREGTTVLFPIRLDDAVMDAEGGWPQLIRNTRYIGDFRLWKNHDAYRKAFERLLRDLKAEKPNDD